MSLSDKGYSYPSEFGLDFHGEDVKDAVKELQNYVQEIECPCCGELWFALGINDKIKSIFGEKLTGEVSK